MVILGALGGGIDILTLNYFKGCAVVHIFIPETPDSNTFTICKNNIWYLSQRLESFFQAKTLRCIVWFYNFSPTASREAVSIEGPCLFLGSRRKALWSCICSYLVNHICFNFKTPGICRLFFSLGYVMKKLNEISMNFFSFINPWLLISKL